MSDKAIIVENLSKLYRIGLKEQMSETLGGAIGSWFRSPLSNFKRLRRLTNFDAGEYTSTEQSGPEDLIWAIKDVSFNVKHGEVVGIIGRNGADQLTIWGSCCGCSV
jgi:lipopolysaccharide transport system ATP-binding protein